MSAHTPGPWIAVEARHREIEITTQARIDSSQGCICEMDIDFDGAHGIEQPANARLLAASPDLLAALVAFTKKAQKYHDDCGHGQPGCVAECDAICDCLPAANTAIAKAQS